MHRRHVKVSMPIVLLWIIQSRVAPGASSPGRTGTGDARATSARTCGRAAGSHDYSGRHQSPAAGPCFVPTV